MAEPGTPFHHHGPDDEASLARVRARLVSQLAERAQVESAPPRARARTAASTTRWVTLGLVTVTAACLVLVGTGGVSRLFRRDTLPAGTLPLAHLTPGATVDIGLDSLCAGRVPAPPPIHDRVRDEVVRQYRMAHIPAEAYELDYLITPELGGAAVAENLWPEPYEGLRWNALVKDHLERLLPRLVCAGELDLRTAQADIARDWVAAYRKYFSTSTPLREYTDDAARGWSQRVARASRDQSNNRKFFGPLFIITAAPDDHPGSGWLVTSIPSVASAAVFTSKTSFE